MTYDYDLFIMGAGSAGAAAASKAASLGLRVAVAEQEALGGTCLNRGCIPKKLIVYAADFALHNKIATDYGWSKSSSHFDWTQFIHSVHKQIDSINRSYQERFEKTGIELIRGHATFADTHTIKVDGRKITADKILIAVGARPFIPDIPGIEYAITSREMFHLPYLPKRLAIIGGGYIGVEFSSMMNAFGCRVTVVDTDETVLEGFDDEIRTCVQESLSKRGIKFVSNSTATHIKHYEEGLLLNVSGKYKKTIAADTILVATGRAPNTKNLDLENAQVEVGEKGAIKVDEYSRTSQENIFAVGDCTNRLQLTPAAKAEAVAFINTVFADRPQTVNYGDVPSAVFSRPEIASMGMTESQARSEFGDSVKCYCNKFQPLMHQLASSEEQAIVKVVVEGESERVIGIHMLGEHAGDVIQSLGVALRKGITKQDLDDAIAIHPTTAEEFLTLD
ncbi:pyruvate/2-oxoglutarate dehydrogenase complex, dihydrolipoamide dehydrogenase component [Rivularia sp. PCC 7116]|uniref:glutathione-disulfide reductase n=1 Tax=Rivularia sp. PCC 7116 TaxID=373994 RepID=UPI00029F283B|nr:glutathione-disulfide reductase [Rivularia sp. PCC 7116]AFY53168.1 pyruvate/2-oxoglutarate dehydrogenase complex, dihydrolipoamide dehydrogenase component [Rivularia sp. PCC 7116]